MTLGVHCVPLMRRLLLLLVVTFRPTRRWRVLRRARLLSMSWLVKSARILLLALLLLQSCQVWHLKVLRGLALLAVAIAHVHRARVHRMAMHALRP